jgi:hypothetical protein
MKRLLAVVVIAVALAPIASASAATLRVSPSRNIDPQGQLVTMVGTGFPADAEIQLAECTGTPLICHVLNGFVVTNKAGMFVTRRFVAYDLGLVHPFPATPTCSLPTFTGEDCFIDAQQTEPPFTRAFATISFRM